MKKGAIFDMDGLLIDTERLYGVGWRETVKFFGLDWIDGFDKFIAGTNGIKMLGMIHEYYPDVDARAFMDHCIQIERDLVKTDLNAMPGASEILKFFRENGVKTAVASSSPIPVIQDNLGRLGLLPYFDAVTSGEEVTPGHEKPAPDIFLLAAERLKIAPQDCYVFEDGVKGSIAGIAAGCATVMIPDLFQPTDYLKENLTGIYSSLTDANKAILNGEI